MRNTITYRGFTFPAKKIARATIGLEQSLPILTLGIDTFEAEVKCSDPSIEHFQQNEPVIYAHRKKQMGIYYLQSVERVSPDHYTLSAVSTLGLLEQMDFYGGIYTGETVAEVVAAICGSIPYIIKSNLQNIKLYGWLGIMSSRLALQQVLFAIGANLVTDANGVLRIENLWDGISGVLDKAKIYMDDASVKRDPPVTSVTVLEHQYIPGTDRKDLFEGTATEGQRIPFDSPMSDLSAEGFSILESGTNYAVVSAGSGKLTGIPYTHTIAEVTKSVSNAPIKNEERIENVTLVSLVNSNAVAERLSAYYASRQTIHVAARIQREHPGQVVQIYHPFDKKMVQAAIATSDVNISRVLKSDLTVLVDFVPPQSSDVAYFDTRVILTGNGTWTPPEGVDEATAILISGGHGGASGLFGGLPSKGQDSGGTSEWFVIWKDRDVGTGGEGGEPGEPGNGARILRLSLTGLTQSGPINFSCGLGGKGGLAQTDLSISPTANISVAGEAGTDTIFGSASTATGVESDVGYLDPVSNTVFGAKGKRGAKGGKGGSKKTDGAFGEIEPGPDLIYEGVVYHAGANNPDTAYGSTLQRFSDFMPNKPHITATVGAGGKYGAGGGAAVGEDGHIADVKGFGVVTSGASLANTTATGYGGPGGKGGDAVKPPRPVAYGMGGTGGHGGGGPGAPGVSRAEVSYSGVSSSDRPFSPPKPNLVVDTAESLSSRGLGSDGGDGADGCIILYFRSPKIIKKGALVTKDHSFFCDASGRLIIT